MAGGKDETVRLRLSAADAARWRAAAGGDRKLSALIRDAVEAYIEPGRAADLTSLGRKVAEIVRAAAPRRRSR